MGSDSAKGLKGAEMIFLALLTIGLIGLLFLIIYGNLSGNLGFTQTSRSFSGQTINLSNAGSIPAGAQNRVNGGLSSIVMINATNLSLTIDSANYTVDGVTINVTGTDVKYHYSDKNVNVSYSVSYDRDAEINSENVIANLTGGATEFFTFSNVWFILTAITILIGIVLGVISLVRKTGGMSSGNKSRSEFTS